MPITTVKNSRSRDLHSESSVIVGQMSAGCKQELWDDRCDLESLVFMSKHGIQWKNGVELNSGWLSYGKCHTPHDELG